MTHFIEIQLPNDSPEGVTVLSASVRDSRFGQEIHWVAQAGGTAIPPGQTKSLPAQLPEPRCPGRATTDSSVATVLIAGREPALILPAPDPLKVSDLNNREMCLKQSVDRVARLELESSLDVRPDSTGAVMKLRVHTQGGTGSFVIKSVLGTTLLTEDPALPWPTNLVVRASDPDGELALAVQPARCDAHAIAEDKVGTLIPLQVSVDGVQGTIKVAAGTELQGQVYD